MKLEYGLYQLVRLLGVSRLFPSLRTITVYTEVTTNCQNNCVFCSIGKVSRRRGFITDAVRERMVALVAGHPDTKFKVYFHLVGEPLLYPKLEEYIGELAKLPNTDLWVCTNGIALDERRIEGLHGAGLRNIWFTLFYGDEERYHEKARSECFAVARQHLGLLLQKAGLFGRIHVVTFSESFGDLEESLRERRNVTTQKGRKIKVWELGSYLIRPRYLVVSIDGDVTFDWKDYNFAEKIGNILDMDSESILARYWG